MNKNVKAFKWLLQHVNIDVYQTRHNMTGYEMRLYTKGTKPCYENLIFVENLTEEEFNLFNEVKKNAKTI